MAGMSSSSFTFRAPVGGAAPASKILSVWNLGSGLLSFSVTENTPWLTVNPLSGTSTGSNNRVQLNLGVAPAGLEVGSYQGQVLLTGAFGNSPRVVRVTLEVLAPAWKYDANGDGEIDQDEVLTAISDYFQDQSSYEMTLEVIKIYYES